LLSTEEEARAEKGGGLGGRFEFGAGASLLGFGGFEGADILVILFNPFVDCVAFEVVCEDADGV
jgi:hypothetical protein